MRCRGKIASTLSRAVHLCEWRLNAKSLLDTATCRPSRSKQPATKSTRPAVGISADTAIAATMTKGKVRRLRTPPASRSASRLPHTSVSSVLRFTVITACMANYWIQSSEMGILTACYCPGGPSSAWATGSCSSYVLRTSQPKPTHTPVRITGVKSRFCQLVPKHIIAGIVQCFAPTPVVWVDTYALMPLFRRSFRSIFCISCRCRRGRVRSVRPWAVRA